MTSVSAQAQLPSQASNTSSSASQSALSYASTAKKAVSSPSIATGSSAQSPAVAVGGAAAVQHGKSTSISPVNGKQSIPPAVPAVSAPAIAHSSSAINGSTDHGRKSSVTISANGPNGMNGGPVGGSKGNIQFGSIMGSPAVTHSTPEVIQPSASAQTSNPRVTDPPHSPIPIPQPSASGGRPPSGLGGQGNGVAFGSFGGDGDRHMRQASGTQGPLAPGNSQQGHSRRESTQSIHNDMPSQGGNSGRGGYPPQGGRGRGGFNPQYQQNMGYQPNPQNRQFSQGRGGMPPFQQQQGRQMPFPNSPHQAARSPALANSTPNTPNLNPAMPMPSPHQYNAYYPPHMSQPVNPSSLSNQSEYPKFRSGRGNKKQKWQKNNEQYSQRPRPGEGSRELYGHTYGTADLARIPYSSGEVRNVPGSREHMVPGSIMQIQQDNMPPPAAALVDRRESSTEHPSLSLPPLPPPIPSSTPLNASTVQFNNYGYPPQQFDPRGMPMQNTGYPIYPQQQMMQYMPPPQSPQPGYQQPSYVPGQYAPVPAPAMSRQSSQMSEQRPPSSMGPQTPSMTPSLVQSHTSQSKASNAPPAFIRSARKSAAIIIKRPDGEALDIDAFKAPASPAPSNRARTPPVIASTPTPPPKSATPLHSRTDSGAVKTNEQIRAEVLEKVKKAAEADKVAATEAKEAEAAKAAEAKAKEEQKAKEEAAKLAAEAEAKKEADEKAAAEKKKQEEEEELDRQIAEMEAADKAREEAQAAVDAKRAAEKAAAAKAEAEKKAASAAENDQKLKDAEREMERLEDEKEKKRAEAEAKAKGGDKVEATESKKDLKPEIKDENKAPNTPTTLASRLSSLSLRTDSGASTPASDDSMGPPPPKVHLHADKRNKPAALNLAPLNTKPIEPPQPSAALQSLKSARFLTVLNSNIYPPNIASPNPALNQAVTTKGKSFKYDKEFLLQFQKVFTEKPSLEFESQVKALIGDGDGGSARSGSNRTPGGMASRGQNASRTLPGAFAMGSFTKTLPPGTTSADRFAMSQGAMPRPAINSIGSFRGGPGNSFQGGNPMSRSSSVSNMNNPPHSPRTQSRRGGGGSKRDNYQGSAKAEAQAAKTMPLTAGMDLKPIQVSASGWKPRSINQGQSATGAAGPTPGAAGGSGHMDPDMVQRKVKAALNKMTPEKFDKLADQILAIAAQSKDEADGRTLRQVIQLTFEKATDEAHWASMYAKFCKRMLETMSPDIKDESILDKNGHIVSGGNLFRKYLLNRCQEEFERGWKMDLPEKPEGERGEEKTHEAVMLSDEYYIAEAAKRRGLGLVQFIGELYKLGMLTERIMHECVKKLVDYNGIPDEAEIESLTKLLKTIGGNLDSTEKGRPLMDVYFARIQSMIDTPELPSRLSFMLMDIMDLRKKHWASKEDNKGPKTLDEVRQEAEAAAAHKAAESARSSRGGGGGGGRMQMGRGDSRNFSNSYGNQPPVDYQRNTVGMDDLRRLTKGGNAQRALSQQQSFGPTSMFSSRSNSGRKMGPGGSLSRTGEDSGASSRTGTPPQQKEKESTAHANAFSLLASLGSGGDADHPGSPPSTSVSPALSKATIAEKSEDK